MPTEDSSRAHARALARDALAAGEPLRWFEQLYAQSAGPETIPWADLRPNPFLLKWIERYRAPSGRCLVVGCGLGDDAHALSELGLDVTAFDVSPTAIDRCRRRFPGTRVVFSVADVMSLPEGWLAAFDFVLSAYTLQVLPPELRRAAAAGVISALAPGGIALVLSRGRSDTDPTGEMPWPLTRDELMGYFVSDLGTVELSDFVDDEEPPVRRLHATFRRPA